jgi:hypothetical protein
LGRQGWLAILSNENRKSPARKKRTKKKQQAGDIMRRDLVATALVTFVLTRVVDMVLLTAMPCDCGAPGTSHAGLGAPAARTGEWPLPASAATGRQQPDAIVTPVEEGRRAEGGAAGSGLLRMLQGRSRLAGTDDGGIPPQSLPAAPVVVAAVSPCASQTPAPSPSSTPVAAVAPAEAATAATPTRQPTTPGALTTTRKCYRMPPWGDVCLYHNACFTGNAWYFFEDSAPKTIREHRIWSGGWLA